MKATVHFYCAPSTEAADYQAEDICISVSLPFMPQPAMTLKVTPEGEFYRVDEVFWDISHPDEVTVFLEEPKSDDMEPWDRMHEQGWRIL